MTRIIFAALLVCSLAHARAPLDPQAERIMEVFLDDGSPVSNALVIYPSEGSWMVPLGALTEVLGISVQVWDRRLIAEGFIIDESRPFHLSVAECAVRIDGEKSKFPCDAVLAQDGDLYVTQELFAKWFPVDLRIEPYRSRIQAVAREVLPVQARRARERLADRARGNARGSDPGYPRLDIPYRDFQVTSWDQQLFAAKYSEGADNAILNATTQISGEAIGLESYLWLNGSERHLDGWRVMLSRKSSQETFGGALKLRQLQLIGVELPTQALLAPAQPGLGFQLSSFALDTPNNFGSTDLTGPLAPGWEVLLFRNEMLLDRQTTDSNGFYRFKDIPLLYGTNIFRLAFFGPQGQRRDDYRTYVVDPTQLRSGERDYRAAFASLNNGANEVGLLQVSQALGAQATLQTTAYVERDPQYRLASLALLGVNPLFFYSLRGAFSSRGGFAFEGGQQFGIGFASIGTKYTRLLGNFGSRTFNIDPNASDRQVDQLEANLNFLLPLLGSVGFTSEAIRRTYLSTPEQVIFRNRAGTFFGPLQLQTEAEIAPNSAAPLLGRTQFLLMGFYLQLRSVLEYVPERFTATEAEIRIVDRDRYSIGAAARFPFENLPTTGRVELSRLFPSYSLGVFATTTPSAKAWGAGIQFQSSLVRDERDGVVHTYRQPQAQFGAASVHAFQDLDNDGKKGPAEPVVSGLPIRVNSREKIVTDATGTAFVRSLRPHSPTDLEFLDEDFASPHMHVPERGYRIVPRAGVVAQIDVPISMRGQIDGSVSEGKQNRSRVAMELLDAEGRPIARTNSDADGFYAFENVPTDKSYRVRIWPKWLEEQGYRATPGFHQLKLRPEGEFVSGRDFLLQPVALRSGASGGKKRRDAQKVEKAAG